MKINDDIILTSVLVSVVKNENIRIVTKLIFNAGSQKCINIAVRGAKTAQTSALIKMHGALRNIMTMSYT